MQLCDNTHDAVQMRLRGGVDDVVDALLHGIFPEEFEEEYLAEEEDHPNEDVPADNGQNEGPAALAGARRVLPKRPTAKFYCEVANETLHPGTQITVNQAVYCALKIKVDYNIHDIAFDSMIKFASAVLPPGHFLPGYGIPQCLHWPIL